METHPDLTPEQRLHYITEAAYFIAEQREFSAGCELDDWLHAEREIDRLLGQSAQ